MKSISFALLSVCFLSIIVSCRKSATAETVAPAPTPAVAPRTIARKFAYPVGKTETVSEAKDKKDEWYNAQDFGANNHLGEDWNLNSGGNTDCGETVYAIADGSIVYADNAGAGWGNVVIIEHNLPDGTRVESLYGHLQKIHMPKGEVKYRQKIGEVGNADGRYLCHLHFEIRRESSPMWNQAGAGYAAENEGWLDPSRFIDSQGQNRLR